MFPRPPRIKEESEEPIPWALPIPPFIHRPYCAPPLLVFYPPGRRSKPLRADYVPTRFEGTINSNHNRDGDPTYGPQFVGAPGSFFHETVRDNLARVTRMWYRAYREVIWGVVRLCEEIPWEDEQLRENLDWTREVLVMVHELGHRIVPNYNPKVM